MERIIINNLSKKFRIGFKKRQNTLERFISLFSGREPKREFWVLKNISLELKEGEILGIIGKNASGKSTLLRVIAGIYDYDKGEVKVNGKITSFIDLSMGFKHRLTMKENIYLCCFLFGLSKSKIKKSLNSIVKFSELEAYTNTKLYQFSSGMLQRLAFSIAIHCKSDILLLDEVFAVGDEKFKIKSANKINELAKKGVAVLLVSHTLDIIKKYCDRVIWMDNGKIVREGSLRNVIEAYLKRKSRHIL